MESLLKQIIDGNATQRDVDVLNSVATNIGGRTLCALGEFARNPSLSSIRLFPEDYKSKLKATDVQELPVAAD